MSSIRPPTLAGPIERNRNGFSNESVDWLIINGWTGAVPCGSTVVASRGISTATRAARTDLRNAFIKRPLSGKKNVQRCVARHQRNTAPLLRDGNYCERLRWAQRRHCVADKLGKRCSVTSRCDERTLRWTASSTATESATRRLTRSRRRRIGAEVPCDPAEPRLLVDFETTHLSPCVVGNRDHELGIARQRVFDVVGEDGTEWRIGTGPVASHRADTGGGCAAPPPRGGRVGERR